MRTLSKTEYKVNDWVDINPHIVGHFGWRAGLIRKIDHKQLFVQYLHLRNDNFCELWVHEEDPSEVRPFLSMMDEHFEVGIESYAKKRNDYNYDENFDFIAYRKFHQRKDVDLNELKQEELKLLNEINKIKQLIFIHKEQKKKKKKKKKYKI